MNAADGRASGGSRPADVPDWLQDLVGKLDNVAMAELTRLPQPPGDASPAAVLILFADGPDGPELLLTRRGESMRNHAGQISFPGGKSDPGDRIPADTALREANEEVGLDPAGVRVVGELPSLWIPPSNHAVTPVVGYWTEPTELASTSTHEVVQVLHQSIDELIDPTRRFNVIHPSGWIGPAFDVGLDIPLWGFTAGLVSGVLDLLGWTKPWDESDHRELPAGAFR